MSRPSRICSATKIERLAARDTRLSLQERYGTQRGYLCVVRNAANDLVNHRFLLKKDAEALISQAEASNILFVDTASSKVDRRL
jgi:hypothetical protein